MPKVEIKQVTLKSDYEDTERSAELVYVDGVLVAKGTYGGEPEDNKRYRTYSWVPNALSKLALALGADVVMSGSEVTSEEYEELVWGQ